ncbi:hypothetical protein [Pseudomonas nitroreducens]|uniref:hypothetical protein n=1 Tax=Pseudomonas nitroreducens TaxID=46680 RepID=UPI002659AACD|nr:hypothetical protein [Pseudomonas nitroreducens]MCP1647260.1 hypothetical protein [Pseudomonas nitroreducens]MCP1685836.1 hypothetical protein [Pseudomonas nitroreducens]
MRRNFPLCRLSPEAAGQLMHDHERCTKKLLETERYLAALTVEIRNTLGPETVWSIQAKARQTVALNDLQKELRA